MTLFVIFEQPLTCVYTYNIRSILLIFVNTNDNFVMDTFSNRIIIPLFFNSRFGNAASVSIFQLPCDMSLFPRFTFWYGVKRLPTRKVNDTGTHWCIFIYHSLTWITVNVTLKLRVESIPTTHYKKGIRWRVKRPIVYGNILTVFFSLHMA